MKQLLSVFKKIGGPGSLGFFLVFTVIGVALMYWPRTRRWGRVLVAVLVASYLILSLPVVSHALAARAGAPNPESVAIAGKLDDLFILDGDNHIARAATAAKINAASTPGKVWVLGGYPLKKAVLEAGVPDDPSGWSGSARNTQQQMAQVARLMKENGSRRAAVIVSRLQAARTRGLADRLGVDVVVIPAPVDNEPPAAGARRWLPSYAGLLMSRDALYEMVALAYYRRNGWI